MASKHPPITGPSEKKIPAEKNRPKIKFPTPPPVETQIAYCDGSFKNHDILGKCGGVGYLFRHNNETLEFSESVYKNFETCHHVEFLAAEHVLKKLRAYGYGNHKIFLRTDSDTVIDECEKPFSATYPDHVKSLNKLRKTFKNGVFFQNIDRNSGEKGNVQADELAKDGRPDVIAEKRSQIQKRKIQVDQNFSETYPKNKRQRR